MGSYWWTIGKGEVGYSRIWDGISPDPTIQSVRINSPRTQVIRPDPYTIYGLGFLYGTEKAIRKSRRDE